MCPLGSGTRLTLPGLPVCRSDYNTGSKLINCLILPATSKTLTDVHARALCVTCTCLGLGVQAHGGVLGDTAGKAHSFDCYYQGWLRQAKLSNVVHASASAGMGEHRDLLPLRDHLLRSPN